MMFITTRGQFPYVLSLLVGLWIVNLAASVSIPPTPKIPLHHKVVCQNDKLKIRCANSSYALDIRGGTYGRTLSGNVVCSYKGYENDFYYNCGENDVLDKLKDLCQNKTRCKFVVGTALFGDPCSGRAYLNMNYRCIEKKRKKNRIGTPYSTAITTKMKNDINTVILSTLPTANKTTTTLNINGSAVDHNTTGNPNVTGLQDIPLVSKTKNDKPGIMISMIMWIVYVKERWSSFKTVFFISIGASLFLLVVIVIVYLLLKRREKKIRRHSSNNKPVHHQKLNPTTTLNGDVKKTTELDTLSNTFPAPISTLPPPPDDMIYPSPSPDMINATRPPPPPAPRGSSLDDISKIGQERNSKNVELTRSLSMRARPPDYYSKDLNFDKYTPKLHPIQCCPDINSVLPSKESTMYMNPMYENGHIKEVTC